MIQNNCIGIGMADRSERWLRIGGSAKARHIASSRNAASTRSFAAVARARKPSAAGFRDRTSNCLFAARRESMAEKTEVALPPLSNTEVDRRDITGGLPP